MLNTISQRPINQLQCHQQHLIKLPRRQCQKHPPLSQSSCQATEVKRLKWQIRTLRVTLTCWRNRICFWPIASHQWKRKSLRRWRCDQVRWIQKEVQASDTVVWHRRLQHWWRRPRRRQFRRSHHRLCRSPSCSVLVTWCGERCEDAMHGQARSSMGPTVSPPLATANLFGSNGSAADKTPKWWWQTLWRVCPKAWRLTMLRRRISESENQNYN